MYRSIHVPADIDIVLFITPYIHVHLFSRDCIVNKQLRTSQTNSKTKIVGINTYSNINHVYDVGYSNFSNKRKLEYSVVAS
jgi:hypothetical protein